jgi:3-hydroxyacyl-[acyl-carrier-protein] dehydratase
LFVDAAGALNPAALVELAAQGAAALKGCQASLRSEPVRIGYLVGIRDFELPGQAGAGDALIIVAAQEFAMDQAALVRAEVRCGERLLGAGTIKVWEERAWPEPPPLPPELGALHPPLERTSLNADGMDPIGQGIAAALLGLEPAVGENQVVGWFRFGDDFTGFRGHFPGYPILPAVVMPRLALALAGMRLDRPLTLRKIESAKITRAVFPGQPVRVEVTRLTGPQPHLIRLKARLTSPGGPVATSTLGAE